jgi:hypothetical protein
MAYLDLSHDVVSKDALGRVDAQGESPCASDRS